MKKFLAGLFDILFFLAVGSFLFYLKKFFNIDKDIYLQIISSFILLIYLGFIPYKYDNKTLSEILLNIDSRIKIKDYLKEDMKKNRILKFFIIFENRFILFLFDVFGYNLVVSIMKKLFLLFKKNKKEKKNS